jgi:sec-independent protein translocase protein TatA
MGISVWQLLIILAIVLVLFGAKRLRNIGGDLGGAIKGFRKAMKEDESPGAGESKLEDQGGSNVIEGEVTSKKQDKV